MRLRAVGTAEVGAQDKFGWGTQDLTGSEVKFRTCADHLLCASRLHHRSVLIFPVIQGAGALQGMVPPEILGDSLAQRRLGFTISPG